MKTKSTINICQLTTVDTNVGDDWIREGICYLIERSCDFPVNFNLVNIHDWKNTVYDEEGKDKILCADSVMMAGTPFYFINERRDLLRKTAKWIFSILGWFRGYSAYDGRCSGAPYVKPIWYDRIRKIYPRIPIAILAAGTNLPYDSDAHELIQDPYIKKFLMDIHSWSCLTTVREDLASQLLTKIKIEHSKFPCTAFWAMDRIGISSVDQPELIAFNFMPAGGHFRFERKIVKHWQDTAHAIFTKCVNYYGKNRIRFICHDHAEADAATSLVGGAFVWFDEGYQKTIEKYRYARTGVVNRCHALIAMAGYGSPGMVVGKDTRTLMAEEVGLPRFHYERVDGDELFRTVQRMYEDYEIYHDQLIKIKKESEAQYIDLLKERYIAAFQ